MLAVIVYAAQWCPRCRGPYHRTAFQRFGCDAIEDQLAFLEQKLSRVIWGG